MRYNRRVFAAARIPPFINLTNYEAVEKLVSYLITFQKAMGFSKRVSFTVGFDDTVVFNLCHIIQIHGGVGGRNFPNHFFDVKVNSDM